MWLAHTTCVAGKGTKMENLDTVGRRVSVCGENIIKGILREPCCVHLCYVG
jgi:hypothetical protein